MAFNKQFYTDKLAKLQHKNQRILQEYINTGIRFGQDIAELNQEIQEIQQLIKENEKTPTEVKQSIGVEKAKKELQEEKDKLLKSKK